MPTANDTELGSNRGSRYLGRAALRTITTVRRCYDCGRLSRLPGGIVAVRQTEAGVVGYAGLETCGRVWLCPVCNSKVMARRAVEIGAVLTWAHVQGYQVVWGALTCWHNDRSKLRDLLDIQRDAWRHVVNSRVWRKNNATRTVDHVHLEACPWDCERKRDIELTEKNGRVGYIRAAELTVGGNGWHPHFHPIILVRGSVEYAQGIADEIVSAWVDGVEASGGVALRNGSQQLRVVTGVAMFDELSSYVTKATYEPSKLALETVWSQGKSGRGRVKETVSHWTLLAAVELGLSDDADKWLELEAATPQHRMIAWSRGLRTFAGLSQEKDDEEIAGEEVGNSEDTVCVITSAGWLTVRDRPEVAAQILDILESSGWPALQVLLDAYGIEWVSLADLADTQDEAENFPADSRTREETEPADAWFTATFEKLRARA